MIHLNSFGLERSGFKLIAAYNCYMKSYGDRLERVTVECWKSEKEFLVRQIGKRRTWDLFYSNADKANAKVKWLFEHSKYHKKIF